MQCLARVDAKELGDRVAQYARCFPFLLIRLLVRVAEQEREREPNASPFSSSHLSHWMLYFAAQPSKALFALIPFFTPRRIPATRRDRPGNRPQRRAHRLTKRSQGERPALHPSARPYIDDAIANDGCPGGSRSVHGFRQRSLCTAPREYYDSQFESGSQCPPGLLPSQFFQLIAHHTPAAVQFSWNHPGRSPPLTRYQFGRRSFEETDARQSLSVAPLVITLTVTIPIEARTQSTGFPVTPTPPSSRVPTRSQWEGGCEGSAIVQG